jgi:hypothetical protein
MSRLLLLSVALGSAALGALAAGALVSPAEASGTKVVCQQVLQRPGALDEAFVANFMSEQLAQGRDTFTTVHGISTVICAY